MPTRQAVEFLELPKTTGGTDRVALHTIANITDHKDGCTVELVNKTKLNCTITKERLTQFLLRKGVIKLIYVNDTTTTI